MTLAHDQTTAEEHSTARPLTAELHRAPSALSHDARACLELAATPLRRLLLGRSDNPSWHELSAALHAVRSAQKILRELEGRASEASHSGNLHAALQRCDCMFGPTWKGRVRLVLGDVTTAAPVGLSQLQLERVLVALLDNAATAIRGPGTIEVTASHLPYMPGPLGLDTPGAALVVVIEDTGRGVGTDDVARAFWTSTSRSTDVPAGGLAIAMSIVREAGGRLDFETGPRGTRVRLYLPLAH